MYDLPSFAKWSEEVRDESARSIDRSTSINTYFAEDLTKGDTLHTWPHLQI